jgi:hypothetical protein
MEFASKSHFSSVRGRLLCSGAHNTIALFCHFHHYVTFRFLVHLADGVLSLSSFLIADSVSGAAN